VSREFHLITRERPTGDGFRSALGDATGDAAEPEVEGEFDDPNAYLNVSGPRLWIEIEPPGHVEAADLDDSYDDTTTLPDPDGDLCLWLTVANVPAGAPADSAEVIWRVFEDLATRYDGIAIEPSG
jgi:hypothetical protein